MISLETMISFSAYLGIILMACTAFSSILQKAESSSGSLSLLSNAETCAFTADSMHSGFANGFLDINFSCSAESGNLISSSDGNSRAYANTVSSSLSASADSKASIKVIPKRHYG